MKHIRLQAEDVPPALFLMDRRVSRERRMFWRGGRRDSDWTARPLGAWDRLTDTPPGWKRVLASLIERSSDRVIERWGSSDRAIG